MKKFLFIIIVATILAAVIGGTLAYISLKDPIEHETATLTIQRGTPLIMIAKQLSQAGVIKNPFIFAGYARLKGIDKKIKAGEYEFESGLSSLGVLRKLATGECKLYKITLIEGWTLVQMADYLAQQPFAIPGFRENFVFASHNPFFLKPLGIKTGSAEGFLFPNTYFIERPKGAETVIKRLYDEFQNVWTPEFDQRAQELGMNKAQVVTLASIVEKETGAESERAIVASVYHNRLKLGMPLQADPTVIYGLKDFDGNLRRTDLADPHPYNTYVHKGLPLGPIANPGLASIKATLWPAQTDYLYFVSRNNGTHEFTKTLAEHNKAVMKWQK